jgi:hypothetical protein
MIDAEFSPSGGVKVGIDLGGARQERPGTPA